MTRTLNPKPQTPNQVGSVQTHGIQPALSGPSQTTIPHSFGVMLVQRGGTQTAYLYLSWPCRRRGPLRSLSRVDPGASMTYIQSTPKQQTLNPKRSTTSTKHQSPGALNTKHLHQTLNSQKSKPRIVSLVFLSTLFGGETMSRY
jgi:hypothetical protein